MESGGERRFFRLWVVFDPSLFKTNGSDDDAEGAMFPARRLRERDGS